MTTSLRSEWVNWTAVGAKGVSPKKALGSSQREDAPSPMDPSATMPTEDPGETGTDRHVPSVGYFPPHREETGVLTARAGDILNVILESLDVDALIRLVRRDEGSIDALGDHSAELGGCTFTSGVKRSATDSVVTGAGTHRLTTCSCGVLACCWAACARRGRAHTAAVGQPRARVGGSSVRLPLTGAHRRSPATSPASELAEGGKRAERSERIAQAQRSEDGG